LRSKAVNLFPEIGNSRFSHGLISFWLFEFAKTAAAVGILRTGAKIGRCHRSSRFFDRSELARRNASFAKAWLRSLRRLLRRAHDAVARLGLG